MAVKNKTKNRLMVVIGLLAIAVGLLGPMLMVMAEDDAKATYDKEVSKYLEGTEEFTDVIEKMGEDAETNPNPDKNTIGHVMQRLFYPGVYINDAEYGVVGSDLGVSKDDLLADGVHLCNPSSPQNLINHNCNIPNFTTGLLQNFVEPDSAPFNNAEKTSAHSAFGLGIPKGIPGGEVPIVPGNRSSTYTALELYGYDLKLTSYNGEWDNINVSSQARMLSNFGVIDKVTLLGTSLWNSTRAGISEGIDNFSFNPIRWIGNISSVFKSAISGGLNTVLDTSDMNIVATHGWKRESFNDTLYNVYVLSDKEVISETSKRYVGLFTSALDGLSDGSDELKLVEELRVIPGFDFKDDWETEESEKARADAEEKNKEMDRNVSASKDYNSTLQPHEQHLAKNVSTPNYVEVPEPVYYTEEEQLDFWAEDNSVIIGKAAEHGLISGNSSDYIEYTELVEKWNSSWDDYRSREFDAAGVVVTDLLEKADKDVFVKNPHLDPKQAISHYACANENGTIMRNENGAIEYLYLKNNSGSNQYLNPKCKSHRAPISEARFGSGWHIKRPVDTRHVSNISSNKPLFEHNLKTIFASFFRSINSFIAKVTNIVLDLSFSPILDKLGINTIVEEMIRGFRDTIFFPMAALVVAAGALILFFQVLKNGSALQLLTSVLVTIVIFVSGSVFLLSPTATLKVVDEIPSKIDSFLAEAVLNDDDGTSYCTTGDAKDGIRSAQCNVWGAMVFEPWVHLQFGTGYDNLYANGKAPSGSGSFNNKNSDLVGDAEVNLGGGVTVNNWAMYQLEKTKTGTITTRDTRNTAQTGTVDKDMFRLVDLQAGPNGGAGTDPQHFDSWSGLSRDKVMLNLLTTIQSGVMSFALIGIGMSKIEVSFMFAISIIFLPIMLLYALTPMGKPKLRSYLANLVSLLIRRGLITILLSVLLKTITLSFSQTDSIITGGFLSIAISIAFIMYQKELLNMITASEGSGMMSGDTRELKETIKEGLPVSVSQKARMISANVKGAATGAVGATVATGVFNAKENSTINSLERSIEDLERKEDKKGLTNEEKQLKVILTDERDILSDTREKRRGIGNNHRMDEINKKLSELNNKFNSNGSLSEEDKAYGVELQKELDKIKETRKKNRDKSGVVGAAREGALTSSSVIGRRESRRIRKDGYSLLGTLSGTKEEVINKGADSLVEGQTKADVTAADAYRETMSHVKDNKDKTSRADLTSEEARMLRDPKVQKKIRKLAEERDKQFNEGKNKDNYTALTPDVKEMEKLANYLDKKRKAERMKPKNLIHPLDEREIREETRRTKTSTGESSNVNIIKDELIDKQDLDRRREVIEKNKKEREAQEEIKKQENKLNSDERRNKNKRAIRKQKESRDNQGKSEED